MKCDRLSCSAEATRKVKLVFRHSVRNEDLCAAHAERLMETAINLPQCTAAYDEPTDRYTTPAEAPARS